MAERTYIIAEAGVNHNGCVERAVEMVWAAADAGADAVKFQTFNTEELVTPTAEKCDYQKDDQDGDSQFAMLKQLELSESDYQQILKACRDANIEFLSTAFDVANLDFLQNVLGIKKIKIPSGELVNPVLLAAAGKSGLPVIVSTGMSFLSEVEEALKYLAFGNIHKDQVPSRLRLEQAYASAQGQEYLQDKVTLLHCTSSYPAPVDTVNLAQIKTLRDAFNLSVGYSDHTEGILIPVNAVVLGAGVIEKHFTLDKGLSGPDHKASLEPDELKEMCLQIRMIENAIGSPVKMPQSQEVETREKARRILVAGRDLKAGTVLQESDLALKRSGAGISALNYWSWVGKTIKRDYAKYESLKDE